MTEKEFAEEIPFQLLTVADAAREACMDEAELRAEIAAGRFPPPFDLQRNERYHPATVKQGVAKLKRRKACEHAMRSSR